MKKIFLLSFILFISCNTNNPKKFSEKALQDMVLTVTNEKMTVREVLHKNKGKTILIDVWASWCKDCIVSLPDLEEVQKNFNKHNKSNFIMIFYIII